MRYQGVNRVSPRGGLRTHVALIRTLRSYVEGHLLDLADMNQFQPVVGEGADDYGRDDVVEATMTINGQRFVFHIEGSDSSDDETIKPRGLLGVLHRESGMTVKGIIDQETSNRIEQFVRSASK